MYYVYFVKEEQVYKGQPCKAVFSESEEFENYPSYYVTRYQFDTESGRDKFITYLYENVEHFEDGRFSNMMNVLRGIVSYKKLK